MLLPLPGCADGWELSDVAVPPQDTPEQPVRLQLGVCDTHLLAQSHCRVVHVQMLCASNRAIILQSQLQM